MADHKKRFTNARDFRAEVESITSPEHWDELIHARIGSVVEAACSSDGAKPPFSRQQVEVLHEICFHIVALIKPPQKSKGMSGVVSNFLIDFKQQRPTEKFKIVLACLAVLGSAAVGVFQYLPALVRLIASLR
jgi:hypothetical protein